MDFLKVHKKYLPLILLVLVTIWLRLANLGYSDFQGDEIKALFLPEAGQSLWEFLLAQRKGPTQFLVTYTLGFFDPLYTNQFLLRLPFAIASIFSVYFFYKFVRVFYSAKIAYYSAFLFSVQGILVAFARIVQYQSFVILFYTMALYFFALSIKSVKWRIAGIYYGMAFWGLSMLSHYDGIFIAPVVAFMLLKWFIEFPSSLKTKVLHIFLAGLIVVLILGSFYIPFVLSLSQDTLDYWLNRLSGGEDKISSSVITFKVYNPQYIIHVFTVLFGLYFVRLAGIIASLKLSKIQITPKLLEKYKLSLVVLLWFIFPWLFMEVLTSVPGTHIYTYLTPLFILLALGIEFAEDIVKKITGVRAGTVLAYIAVITAFLFMFYQSHKVFVDHTREYPWEQENFLFWILHKPNTNYHLSLFGFPYFRHWEDVGAYVTSTTNNGYYSTNERKTISRHYVPYHKDTNKAGHFVYIDSPQTFLDTPSQRKAQHWMQSYKPVKSFKNCDYGDFAWGGDLFYTFAPVNEDCEIFRELTQIYYMEPKTYKQLTGLD